MTCHQRQKLSNLFLLKYNLIILLMCLPFNRLYNKNAEKTRTRIVQTKNAEIPNKEEVLGKLLAWLGLALKMVTKFVDKTGWKSQ